MQIVSWSVTVLSLLFIRKVFLFYLKSPCSRWSVCLLEPVSWSDFVQMFLRNEWLERVSSVVRRLYGWSRRASIFRHGFRDEIDEIYEELEWLGRDRIRRAGGSTLHASTWSVSPNPTFLRHVSLPYLAHPLHSSLLSSRGIKFFSCCVIVHCGVLGVLQVSSIQNGMSCQDERRTGHSPASLLQSFYSLLFSSLPIVKIDLHSFCSAYACKRCINKDQFLKRKRMSTFSSLIFSILTCHPPPTKTMLACIAYWRTWIVITMWCPTTVSDT